MAKKKSIETAYTRNSKASVYVYEDHKFQHAYDIIHDTYTEETELRYSDTGYWTSVCEGEEAGAVRDDGNNVTIRIEEKHITLDYAQMEILTALILACNETRMELRQHKIISSISSLNETI